MTDGERLQKFNADFAQLQRNREKVPLDQLQTRYSKAYNALVTEVTTGADWFADTHNQLLVGTFPRRSDDHAGNEWLDRKIAAILEEERRPGGLVERYRAALLDHLDRGEYERLVYQRYDRLLRDAFDPYWQRHCFWTGPPGNRWIYNDIIRKFWQAKDKTNPTDGCWINSDYTGQDPRFPPNI